jgi:PKD repeat protein
VFPAAAVTGAGGVPRVLRRVLLVLAAAMSWLAVSAFPGVAAPTPLSAGTEGPPPLPPIAVFEAACEDLTCFLDASASFDPDGAIVSYDWDFGDGTHGQGIAREQVFGEPGTYTIVLTVTDQSGISSAFSQTVTLQLPTGLPPAQSTPPDIVVPPPPTETRYS